MRAILPVRNEDVDRSVAAIVRAARDERPAN